MARVYQDGHSTPAILYAAKSTEDKRGSIPTQLTDARAMAEREGWEVVGEFSDEGFSAFKGNRGPGLDRAKQTATSAAAEGGKAVLVVQHSDRLARGAGDAQSAADHLVEVVASLRRAGVQVRTVEDDFFGDPRIGLMMAAVQGQRNTEDSARKAEAVAAGLRRAAERGQWVGGILPDGYAVFRDVDGSGRVTRTVEFDQNRRPIYNLIWDLAERGHSVHAVVAELDRRAFRTNPRKRGQRSRPFDANRVRQTLDNPFYAGLSVSRGQVVGEGNWPRYVEPEDFYRLRSERRSRAHVERRGPGRPAEGYVLARMARCGECGSPMDTVTGGHIRKDGTRPRRYVCRAHRERPQDCSARPIDAAVVDPSVIDHLDAILGDVDGIRAGVAAARDADRTRLEGEVEAARADAADAEEAAERVSRRIAALYSAGDDEKAKGLEEALAHLRATRAGARVRRDAALDALDAVRLEHEERGECATSFYTQLRQELGERLSTARGDAKRLNVALTDFLESVELTWTERRVRILPKLSETAAARVLADAEAWRPPRARFVERGSAGFPAGAELIVGGERVEHVAKQLEEDAMMGLPALGLAGPGGWEADGEKPHSPW